MEDIVEKDSTSESKVETKVEETSETETTEQDPLKTELERVKKVSKYTEKEKAEHTLKSTAKRLEELGGDIAGTLGIQQDNAEENEDDMPLTVGAFKKFQKEGAKKTALDLAEEIQNETERELTKYHLENTIKSTGIPSEDIKLARALVNAVKNTQIIEETNRKTVVKSHSNSSGVDAKQVKDFVPTADEIQLMRAPFNMSQTQILEARAGKRFSFKNSK